MERLKSLRKERNLNQKELASMINMSQTGYSQYERGTRKISLETLTTLANFYNTSVDYLLNLTDIKDKYTKSKINNNSLNRLKEIREDRDLLQIDIAKILNMSRKGYSHYEANYTEIPINKLIVLAKYYNVSTDYLLYLTDDRTIFKRK